MPYTAIPEDLSVADIVQYVEHELHATKQQHQKAITRYGRKSPAPMALAGSLTTLEDLLTAVRTGRMTGLAHKSSPDPS